MPRTQTIRLVAAGAILALVLTARVVVADEPVIVRPGDEVPFVGVLTSVDDAARLAADLIAARQLTDEYKARLDECYELGTSTLDESLERCRGQLDECYANVGAVEVREVVPWWTWIVIGAALGVGVALGVGFGSL